MIVSDGSQSLYERHKFTWKKVGIKAQGRRTKKLSQNYRNTQEILSAAWSVLLPTSSNEIESEETTFPIIEPRAALRHGQRPVLHFCADRRGEIEAVVAQIQKLHAEGYEPRDIAVLYKYLTSFDTPLLDNLQQQLNDSGLGCYWVTENKSSYNHSREGVRLITALSSLGLEFKVVIILWVQQFGDLRFSQGETLRERSSASLSLFY